MVDWAFNSLDEYWHRRLLFLNLGVAEIAVWAIFKNRRCIIVFIVEAFFLLLNPQKQARLLSPRELEKMNRPKGLNFDGLKFDCVGIPKHVAGAIMKRGIGLCAEYFNGKSIRLGRGDLDQFGIRLSQQKAKQKQQGGFLFCHDGLRPVVSKLGLVANIRSKEEAGRVFQKFH